MGRSIRRTAVLAAVASAVAACTGLSGLSGGEPMPPDGAPVDDASPTATSDAAPEEAGAPSIVDNPSAGLGAYILHGSQAPDASVLTAPWRVEPDGGSVALACPTLQAAPLFNPILGQGEPFGEWTLRARYDPADPSRAKFVFPRDGRGAHVDLYLVDESSRCTGDPPRKLSEGVTELALAPSFSDDGSRVAFVVVDQTLGVRVITVATAGPLDAFELRDVAGTSINIVPVPPIWIRENQVSKVLWLEQTSEGSRIRIAADKTLLAEPPGGDQDQIPTLLRCDGVFYGLKQFSLLKLPAGKVVVAFVANLTDPDAGDAQQGIFAVDYNKSCATRTRLFDDVPGATSRELAVSPDGEWLAHVSNRVTSDLGSGARDRIWIGPVTGASRFVCSDPPMGKRDSGPQWLDGGKQILWTRSPGPNGFGGEVYIADVIAGSSCANARPLVALGPGEATIAARNGCHLGPPRSSDRSALVLGAAAALAVVRRRRRRSSR